MQQSAGCCAFKSFHDIAGRLAGLLAALQSVSHLPDCSILVSCGHKDCARCQSFPEVADLQQELAVHLLSDHQQTAQMMQKRCYYQRPQQLAPLKQRMSFAPAVTVVGWPSSMTETKQQGMVAQMSSFPGPPPLPTAFNTEEDSQHISVRAPQHQTASATGSDMQALGTQPDLKSPSSTSAAHTAHAPADHWTIRASAAQLVPRSATPQAASSPFRTAGRATPILQPQSISVSQDRAVNCSWRILFRPVNRFIRSLCPQPNPTPGMSWSNSACLSAAA